MLFEITTFMVTFLAGIGTGLLGIGGAIIIYPCFLFILPCFVDVSLTINQVSGIAAMQILTGSFSGFLSHRHSVDLLEKKELFHLASFACLGTFVGGVISGFFSREFILSLYLFTVILAIISMLKKSSSVCNSGKSSPLMYMFITVTGLFAGILGVGGAVLYIPILRYFKQLNTKSTVPTTVLIVFMGAIMTFVGKSLSGQILYSLLPLVFLGAFSGAKLGARLNKKASSNLLKMILFMILMLTALRVAIDLIIK